MNQEKHFCLRQDNTLDFLDNITTQLMDKGNGDTDVFKEKIKDYDVKVRVVLDFLEKQQKKSFVDKLIILKNNPNDNSKIDILQDTIEKCKMYRELLS